MQPTLKTLTLLLLAVTLLAGAASAQYSIVGTATTETGGLVRTETTVQDGPSPLDQFKVARLAKAHLAPGEARAVVFWLPALGVDFSSYEVTEPRRPVGASITGFFAQRNFVVYGLSSRAEGVPAGSCELGALDCSSMADWGLQTVVEDVAFARGLIATEDAGLPVFVGGHSLGAISAVAAINDAPGDYDGAFLWEGALASADPQVQGLNQAYCAGLEAQLAGGIFYDGLGNNVFKKAAKAAELQPDGLTPIPLFPSFLTNRQVLVSSLVTPAPGPFTMPVPGYVLANGDPGTGELFHASDERLFENVSRFNDYVPLRVVRDLSCSLAGLETAFTSNLAAFDGPVLALGGDLGFGPFMQDTLDLTGSTDVTVHIEPGFGHVDALLAADHRTYVERPILRWIRDLLP